MKIKKTFTVDSGLVWIGDPCYIIGKDISWNDFCESMNREKPVNKPLGNNTGLAVDSGYGDGEYEAVIETTNSGIVKSISITLVEDSE
jgi:hypothetical protein